MPARYPNAPTPDELRAVAQAIGPAPNRDRTRGNWRECASYGELAAALYNPATGTRPAPRTVRQWLDGRASAPAWLLPALKRLAAKRPLRPAKPQDGSEAAPTAQAPATGLETASTGLSSGEAQP